MTAVAPARRARVLVIEDDREIRRGITDVLADEGYATSEAANGAEALAGLRAIAEAPDVILLDLMMPIMDGMQFRLEQTRDPALSAIPVVIVSADTQARQKAAALGVAGVLGKPLRLVELLAIVARLCRPVAA